MKLNTYYFVLFILIGNTAYSQSNRVDQPIGRLQILVT